MNDLNRQQRRLLEKAKGDPKRAQEIAHSRSMQGMGNASDRVSLAQAMDSHDGEDAE